MVTRELGSYGWLYPYLAFAGYFQDGVNACCREGRQTHMMFVAGQRETERIHY